MTSIPQPGKQRRADSGNSSPYDSGAFGALQYNPTPSERYYALAVIRAGRSLKKLESQLRNLEQSPGAGDPGKLYRAYLSVKRAERRAGYALNQLLAWSGSVKRAAQVVALLDSSSERS